MAVTTTVLRREIENSGSEMTVNAIVSMTGNYDALTGVEIEASQFGLSQITGASIQHDSTYVFGVSVPPDKESMIIRLFDSSIFSIESSTYNSNVIVTGPDATALLYINGTAGVFTPGETVTGGTSGATATVVSYETDIFGNERLEIGAPGLGVFQAAEVVTGGTSGATATTTDETHITFDIDSNLIAPMDLCEGDSVGTFFPLVKSIQFSPSLTVGQYRYWPGTLGGKVETLESDAIVIVRAAGMRVASGSFNSLPEMITGFSVIGLGGLPIKVWGK